MILLVVGALGDSIGLRAAYYWCAGFAMLGLPFVLPLAQEPLSDGSYRVFRRLTLRMTRLALVLLAFAATGCSQQATKEPADMVLTNGKIVTVDEALPEAEAVAFKDGLVLAVGSSEDIAGHIGDTTEVIDLEGQLAVPGFIEGHGHFMSLGNAKMILDLTKVDNWNEIVTNGRRRCQKRRAGKPGSGVAVGTRRSGTLFLRELSMACPSTPV